MKQASFFLAFLFFTIAAGAQAFGYTDYSFKSQVNIGSGVTAKQTNPSAWLELGPATNNSTKAFLMPRGTRSQVVAPVIGLLFYDVNDKLVYQYNGNEWVAVGVQNYTNEMARDAIGSALVNSGSITFNPDDVANTITATVNDPYIRNLFSVPDGGPLSYAPATGIFQFTGDISDSRFRNLFSVAPGSTGGSYDPATGVFTLTGAESKTLLQLIEETQGEQIMATQSLNIYVGPNDGYQSGLNLDPQNTALYKQTPSGSFGQVIIDNDKTMLEWGYNNLQNSTRLIVKEDGLFQQIDGGPLTPLGAGGGGESFYTADGAFTSARTVDGAGNGLSFTNLNNIYFETNVNKGTGIYASHDNFSVDVATPDELTRFGVYGNDQRVSMVATDDLTYSFGTFATPSFAAMGKGTTTSTFVEGLKISNNGDLDWSTTSNPEAYNALNVHAGYYNLEISTAGPNTANYSDPANHYTYAFSGINVQDNGDNNYTPSTNFNSMNFEWKKSGEGFKQSRITAGAGWASMVVETQGIRIDALGQTVIDNAPVYASNAAAVAAGLAVGTIYKTAAGVLMIRY